ncbi:MAG: OmpA family protein [Eubacterium sp.]|nr:OmpA family protein [Eubacterium sp.]
MANIEEEEAADTGGWINTFADLMNLLLCFFVLLFSMSTVDADKYEQLVTSMSESINIFDGGGDSIGQGPFIDSGTNQIVAISQFFNEFESSGQDDDANQNQANLKPGTKADQTGEQTEQGGKEQNNGTENTDPEQANPSGENSQNGENSDNQNQQGQTGQQQDDKKPGEKDAQDIDKATEEAVEAKQAAKQKAKNEETYSDIMDQAQDKNIDDKINVNMDKKHQYVQITLNGALLFDSGSADIKASTKPLLDKVGDILKIYKKNQIRIIGHTDNVPTTPGGRYPNNMWLSTARATTVFEYLVKKKKIDPKSSETTGRGEYDPIASNSTADGRAKNRRVEFRIYTNQ